MMARKPILFLLTLLSFWHCSSAQVVFQFVPEIYGRNINGLFQCRLLNPGKAQQALLNITVTERKIGTVCTINLPAFNLLPGSNVLPVNAIRGASVQFSSNNVGQLLRGNQNFPEGDYDYCFNLRLTLNDFPEEQCFSYTLAPLAEFDLIDPADHDKLCELRPLLTWQPLIPAIQGSFYQLVLAEIKKGQTPVEALNYNLAAVNQSQLTAPVLPYPAISRSLEKGKRYAWQVTAYKDGTILNRSEVWDFTVDCGIDVIKKTDEKGFRKFTDLMKGNSYYALGEIKFSLINPYQTSDVKYEIRSLKHPEKKIKRLPKVRLQNGDNQISIDFKSNNSFKDGEYYTIEIWLSNGTSQSLRFLYEEPQ